MTEPKRGRGVSIQHPFGNMKLPAKIEAGRLQELVTRLRSGQASESDIDELACGHIRLAISIASRFAVRAPYLAELLASEALYGIVLALTKAPQKLYDDNITAYISTWVDRTLLRALVREGNSAHIAQATLHRWRKRGLMIPILESKTSAPVQKCSNLLDVKEEIDACIRTQFELEVIELRKLGFNDEEIAVKMQCSRTKITGAKLRVRDRYDARL